VPELDDNSHLFYFADLILYFNEIVERDYRSLSFHSAKIDLSGEVMENNIPFWMNSCPCILNVNNVLFMLAPALLFDNMPLFRLILLRDIFC